MPNISSIDKRARIFAIIKALRIHIRFSFHLSATPINPFPKPANPPNSELE